MLANFVQIIVLNGLDNEPFDEDMDTDDSSSTSHTEDDDNDEDSQRRSKYALETIQHSRSRKRRRSSPGDEHGSFYDTSVARIVYELACHLGKNNSDMLWFAIVGLTDQYIHRRIDEKYYEREVRYFKDQEASIEEEGSSQSQSNINDAAFDARVLFSEEYHHMIT